MITFLQSSNWPRSFIIILWCIAIFFIYRLFLPSYRLPPSRIDKKKLVVWSWFQIILILLLSIIPLELSIQKKQTDVIVIFDSSLSMSSEDMQPTRSEKSQKIIREIAKKNSISHCFSQNKIALDWCEYSTIIPNSGSSVTDLLALAVYSSSDSEFIKKHKFLVFSDGWINNGINFSSLFDDSLKSNTYRLDFYPGTWDIVISWNTLSKAPQLWESPPLGENHYAIYSEQDEKKITTQLINLIQKDSYISLYPLIMLVILVLCSFFIGQHIILTLKKAN